MTIDKLATTVSSLKADLHIHTTFSDGTLTPDTILKYANECKLGALSITDHDNVGALKYAESRSSEYEIEFIPGIEISCRMEDIEIHMLGYFIDPEDKRLLNYLEFFQNERILRARKILDCLKEHDMMIQWEELKEISGGGSIGRPHIAELMVRKNYVMDYKDAFDNYLGDNCSCYIPKYKISPCEAIKLIAAAGGISFIAHPGVDVNEDELVSLIGLGVDGIETIHPKHSAEEVEKLRKIVREYHLQESGGSDFHGNKKLGPRIGDFTIPYDMVSRLKDYYNRVNLP